MIYSVVRLKIVASFAPKIPLVDSEYPQGPPLGERGERAVCVQPNQGNGFDSFMKKVQTRGG